MRLGELLRKATINYKLSSSQANLEIRGITDDSRRVKRGFLFVAVKGLEHDGHDYVEQAIEKGASTVVFDVNLKFKIESLKLSETTLIAVDNSRKVLGLLWAAWYSFPSRKLKVIGVTGTDGKTTTANLIYRLLERAGKRVGLVSTLGARLDGQVTDIGFHVTTLSPELLQKFLAQMVKKRMDFAVLEVTSHGLDQERLAGVKFYAAVITNVTHEHLDYHKTYHNYLRAKAKLFQDVSWSILNRDDRSYDYLRRLASGKVLTYGIRNSADVRAQSVIFEGEKSRFNLKRSISLSLPGEYNVYNALAAYSTGRVLGLPAASLARGVASFRGLRGRFEEIKEGQPFRVIVDFAHTPCALKQVLGLISKIKNQKSKVICVFGCAGERDKGKRFMMGGIAGRLADISILTAEDPRREDVNKIIEQIAVGCRRGGAVEISNIKYQISPPKADPPLEEKIQIKGKKGKHVFVRESDRGKAIELAVRVARSGDLVLITGKGHEKSMCFGTKEYPWSDQKEAREALRGTPEGW